MILSYRNAGVDPEGSAKEHFVALVTMPGAFGGVRHYFCCPGSGCGRCADILYFDGEIFVCRGCADIAYTSQRESVGDRARRRARKARLKLGGSANLIEALPDKKPKWMRWRTYKRLMAQVGRADACSWASLTGELARLRC